MNWKNTLENLLYMAVIFGGLGFYTSLVLKPIIVEAIRQENTKIENNIKSNIDNKFKKIDELTATLPFTVAPENTQQTMQPQPQKVCDSGFVCVEIKHLTRKQKKRLGVK